MNLPIICILLSAFAFPGAAHFYLKKIKVGALLLTCFCIPFYFVLSFLIDQLFMVYHALFAFKVEPSLIAMFWYMFDNVADENSIPFISSAAYYSLAIWLIGIADSLRLALKENKLR